MAKVGIDPGHGGKDPGVVGSAGTREKDVALGISLFLTAALRRNGFEPCVTRSKDVFVGLSQRSDALNAAKVDLVVSVHCNGFTNPSADYIATFIYASGGQAQTAATLVQREIAAVTGWENGGIKTKNLEVLRDTKAPAILTENGFLSNPKQEQWLNVKANQKKLAEAICKGICAYFGKSYKEEETKVDDVSSWAKEAQKWVVEQGISDGKDPKKPVTREEVWTMLYRLKTKGVIK